MLTNNTWCSHQQYIQTKAQFSVSIDGDNNKCCKISDRLNTYLQMLLQPVQPVEDLYLAHSYYMTWLKSWHTQLHSNTECLNSYFGMINLFIKFCYLSLRVAAVRSGASSLLSVMTHAKDKRLVNEYYHICMLRINEPFGVNSF